MLETRLDMFEDSRVYPILDTLVTGDNSVVFGLASMS